jgi:hypothetical protein
MKGNPVVWLIVQAVLVTWLIYGLLAPGEAQPTVLVVMEVLALIGLSLGLVVSVIGVVGLASRK